MIGTVVDIETTGFLKFQQDAEGRSILSDDSEILEVAFMNINLTTCRPVNYGVLYFYKPYFNIESDAQRIHGITREFIQKYEDKFEENLIALNSLLQSSLIIGKNCNAFDIPVMKAFIEKHAGKKFDIPALVAKADMKGYNGGKVTYVNDMYSIDVQSCYKERFHQLYANKYSLRLGLEVNFEDAIAKFEEGLGVKLGSDQISVLRNVHNQYIQARQTNRIYPIPDKQALSDRKRGTLSEYIDAIPRGKEMANAFYGTLDKDRVTDAHGALYDCVETFIVYLDARANGYC